MFLIHQLSFVIYLTINSNVLRFIELLTKTRCPNCAYPRGTIFQTRANKLILTITRYIVQQLFICLHVVLSHTQKKFIHTTPWYVDNILSPSVQAVDLIHNTS